MKAPVSTKATDADEQVRPGAQPAADVFEGLLQVRGVDETGAVDRQPTAAIAPPTTNVGSSRRRRSTRKTVRATAAASQTGFTPAPRPPRATAAPPGAGLAAAERHGRAASRRDVGEEPKHRGPGAAQQRLLGAGRARGVQRLGDGRAQGSRCGLEVVDRELGGKQRTPLGRRRADGLGQPRQLGRVAGQALAVGLREDRRRRERRGAAQDQDAEGRRLGGGSRRSPAPVATYRAGRTCAGTSAPSPAATSRSRASSAMPDARAARRSAAAASADPPAMPAATGMRFSITSRIGGARQPVRSRKARSAAAARLSPSTPGQTTSSPATPKCAGSRRTRSASVTGWKTVTSSWRPSLGRLGPRIKLRLSFAGAFAQRRGGHGIAPTRGPTASASAASSGGASRSARASGGWPSAEPVRAASRTPGRAPARGQRAGQRLAPVREGGLDDRTDLRRGRGPGAAQDDEHRVDIRHGMEDGACDRPVHAHLAGQLREHRRHTVGGAAGTGGQALADLLLHHGHPALDGGELLDRAQNRPRRDPVGKVGDDPRGGRVERAQVERHGVGHVERGVRV